MAKFWKKHVFTAELPYEEDQPVTLFLRNHFEKVDSYVMSLGQMSRIPPNKLLSYLNGELVQERHFVENSLQASGLKLYFYTIPLALLHVVIDFLRALNSISFRCDIFFAQHFLPAYLAVMLRNLGILHCQKIVFWMFDFFPIPPEFPRGLYYRGIDMIQRFVRTRIDEIWYTTPRLAEVDLLRFGQVPKNVQVRLTEGVFFKRIVTKKPNPIPPLRLAFLGSLRVNNAVYESLECIAYCLRNNLKVELHIIGSGPEEGRMKEFVRRKKIQSAVKFHGFETRGEEIAKIFSVCHLGLALYPSDVYGPNWFLTSGKFRRYVSQGLPVIASTPPYFTKYIVDFNAGLIVDNDPEQVYKTLKTIYEKPSKLLRLRKGVDKLYKQFEAEAVLYKNFTGMLRK